MISIRTKELSMKNQLLILLIALTGTCLAKRHSRERKIERFERRAHEAAKSNTPLASALSKRTKLMSFEEATLALEYYREKKEAEMIIKCGERILAVGGDQEIMRQARLDLAQAFLELGKYKDTEKHALDYLTYYPGAKESQRASYIAIKALYLSQCSSYRDQKKTKDTIEQAEKYLVKYPKDKDHTAEINDILDKSYLKLIRSELNIIETNINMYNHANHKGALKAAQQRVAYVKEHYLKHAPHTKRKLLELEIKLAKTAENKELTTQKKQELAQLGAPKLAKADDPQGPWQWVKSKVVEDNTKYFA